MGGFIDLLAIYCSVSGIKFPDTANYLLNKKAQSLLCAFLDFGEFEFVASLNANAALARVGHAPCVTSNALDRSHVEGMTYKGVKGLVRL